MARPKKNADEKRTVRYNLRFTQAEREAARDRANLSGLHDMEFMRRQILGVALPPSHSHTNPAYIAALNNYALSLREVGNNVNQLTAATHQGRDFSQYWHEIGEELRAEIRAAREALNNALRDMP